MVKRKKAIIARNTQESGMAPAALLNDLRRMIADAREAVARQVDSTIVTLHWHVGRRIRRDILKEKRAEYGKSIVSAVGRELSAEFGRGFSEKSLWHMIRFSEAFPDEKIVSALRRELSWTHFRSLIYLDSPLKRDFYAEMCRVERWDTRMLDRKISGMLYERTALSKKPEKLIRKELAALNSEGKLTPDLVFRDPYFLDFLRLKDTYSEKDLESAILREMESFILEMGIGFTFVERQKRMSVDHVDYYLDLLFYHRKLKRLVAIDLKLGNFKAEYKGQMELYLRWLARYEAQPGEEEPIGLILCAGKSEEHIELLELAKSGVRVATYLTELPPKNILKQKLHAAIEAARMRMERNRLLEGMEGKGMIKQVGADEKDTHYVLAGGN